ncbi:Uncharacterised protein [Yersinia enterocolitica]|nr:Uncharacterised protein [Yersinia enterocolitica]
MMKPVSNVKVSVSYHRQPCVRAHSLRAILYSCLPTLISVPLLMKAPWSTHGQLWVLAHKSVRMFTCLAVLALVACWSHCKLTRPLSKTTALSAHVQKWSKGLSLKKARLFPWAYLSVKAPVFMIVKRAKSIMVAFPQALSLFQVICHQKMVATACTARLS